MVDSVVRGIRIDKELWDACQKAADDENISRNSLVVRLIMEYLDKKENCDA